MNAGWIGSVGVVALAVWTRSHLIPTRFAAPRSTCRRRPPPRPTADQWAALLDAIAADVRGGASLSVAHRQATARRPVHGAVLQPGAGLATALVGHSADPDEALVLHTLTAASALGGPVAATLDGGAALLRERVHARAEARAHSAQARLSARVLTTVPLLFAGGSALSSASFRRAVATGPGVVAATTGALLNLAGWWWMRHEVARVAR